MSSTTQREPNIRATPPANVQLVNWPLRDDGVYAWLLVAVVVAVAVLIGVLAEDAGMTLISLAAMAIAMWRMWIPVTYQFGPKGVVQTVLRRRRRIVWSAVRRCRVQRRGILLLFEDHPSPLATAMGLTIGWGERRDELLELVRYYVGARLQEDESQS